MNPIGVATRRAALLCTAAGLVAGSVGALAQTYPSRAITLVSPAPPGGGTDAIARALADAMGRRAGVPVVVENRPGAYSQIATAHVAQAAPDGYTLLLTASGHTVNPAVFRRLPYDTRSAFVPIARLATSPAVLVANPGLQVGSIQALRDLSRAHPDKVTFASSETSIQLMTSELGMQFAHPPTIAYYKGTGPSINDVLGGHVGFAITSIASVLPFLQDGRLKAVAVTGTRRTSALPTVPTFQEQGLEGLDTTVWQGVLAPAGTPEAATTWLNAAINAALADPAVIERLRQLAYEPAGGTSASFAAFLDEDLARQSALVAKAGLPLQ